MDPLSNARGTWEAVKHIEHKIKLESRKELLTILQEWFDSHPNAPASEVLELIEKLNKDYERKSI